MEFDFSAMAPSQCYKLLVSVVVPRPIALVTSLNEAGVVNAAPFSFFNLMGDDPQILILSIERKPSGAAKDTAHNIALQREFVVNLVDEATAERMHACSRDFPSDESEAAAVGFTTLPSRAVAAPRIAESPVALECKLYQTSTSARCANSSLAKWCGCTAMRGCSTRRPCASTWTAISRWAACMPTAMSPPAISLSPRAAPSTWPPSAAKAGCKPARFQRRWSRRG